MDSKEWLKQIVNTAESIRRKTEHSGANSQLHNRNLSSASSLIPALDLDIPSPMHLVPQLLAVGAPEKVAQAISSRFSAAARDLAGHQSKKAYMDTLTKLVISSSERLDFLPAFQNAHRQTYTRTLSRWTVELLSSVRRKFAQKGDEVEDRGKPMAFKQEFVPLLESYFVENQRPSRADRLSLAKKSGMTIRQINVWFQNRRSRAKKMQRVTSNQENSGSCQSPTTSAQKACGAHIPEYGHTDGDMEREAEGEWVNRTTDGSSSFTLVGNDHLSPKESPSYAFPAIYPPSIPVGEDPFPCRFGDFTKFAKPCWTRHPATKLQMYEPDVSALSVAFENLNIGDPALPREETTRLPWGLYSSAKKSGCDVTLPYTVRPVRAPMISLIRIPASCTSSCTCVAPLGSHKKSRSHSQSRESPPVVEVPKGKDISKSRGSRRRPAPAARATSSQASQVSSTTSASQADSSSFPSSSTASASSPTSMSTSVADPPAKLRKATKESGSARRAYTNSTTKRSKGRAASAVAGPLSNPSTTSYRSESMSNVSSLVSPSTSDVALPSSSSRASSALPSPATTIQAFPDESLLYMFDTTATDSSSLTITPIQGYPPSVFLSNDFSFDFSKSWLDGAFCYGLPTYESPTYESYPLGFKPPYNFATSDLT